MRERRLTEQEMATLEMNHRMAEAYSAVCPTMNRAERRSARGRELVALGEAAALRAKVAFLEERLKYHEGS